MITKDKIEIYDKFDGELDGLKLIGSTIEKEKINEEEWAFIYSLIQDLGLIKKDLVSKDFKERFHLQVRQNVEDSALGLLYKIAIG